MEFVLLIVMFLFVLWLWHYNTSIFRLYLYTVALYLSAVSVRYITGCNVFYDDILNVFAYALGVCSLFFTVFRVLSDIPGYKTISRVISGIILFLFWLFPVSVLVYYGCFGTSFSEDTIIILLQTNFRESFEFLMSLSFGKIFIAVSVFGIFLSLLIYEIKNIRVLYRIKVYYPLVTLGILATMTVSGIFLMVLDVYPVTVVRNTVLLKEKLKNLKHDRKNLIDNIGNLSLKNEDKKLFVVVIGESATKSHLSAYGYERKTTPWLDGIDDKILFSNAYSCHTYTVKVLPKMLTPSSQYNKQDESLSLIDTAKKAGYKTYWISNQEKFGQWGTYIVEYTENADFSHWNDLINTKAYFKTKYYDEKLLDIVKKLNIPEDENNLVFLHLMGSHSIYKHRYPPEFEKFDGMYGEYDNSICYTDYVLKEIYDYFSKKKNFSGMVYLSDHGDAMTLDIVHNPDLFEISMVQIPFVILLSDKYSAKNPDVVKNLKLHSTSFWTNDLFYFTMNRLLEIENIPLYEQEWDISQKEYKGNLENLKTLDGKRNLCDILSY